MLTLEIVTGFGLGSLLQQPNIAAQTVLPASDVSIGFSLLNFTTFLGGTALVTVSQTLLQNQLSQGLVGLIPNFDPRTVTNAGAAALRDMVSADKLQAVLTVYNDSMRAIWYLTLGLSCLIFLASLGLEWKSVKKETEENKDTAAVSV
jgi:hypothetical protein